MGSSRIDTDLAISRLGGAKKLYIKLINGFKQKYCNVYEDLYRLTKDHKHNEARILVHSIKGLSGNVGADKLGFICRELEQVYKENECPNQLLEDFRNEMKLVLCEIDKVLVHLEELK